MRKLLFLIGLPLLASVTLYALFSQAAGTIHYVSATPGCGGQSPCYTTIQAAINATQAGDTVRIQAGTYNEAVLIQGKNSNATEADRITIEADPATPLGSVVLGTTGLVCTAGTLLQIESSKFLTLRGLTLAGAGKQALTLVGKPKANTGIRIERNRIIGNDYCPGGILVGKGNTQTVIANNLIHSIGSYGLNFKQGVGRPHYVVGNTIHANGKSGVYMGKDQNVRLVNNLITIAKPRDTCTETSTVNGRTYSSVYDATTKTFTTTSPEGRQSTATIDAQGRVTQTQIPELLAVNRQYDSRGRLASITQGTGIDARTVAFSYKNDASPSNGYLDAVTDPLNREVSFAYDAAGRVTTQTLPDGRVIGYDYDANGNLTALAPPGKPAHEFTYSAVNLPVSYLPPDPQPPVANPQSSYAYNLDRQLTQVTRPDGKTIALGYDSAGRVATQTIDRGQIGYAYSTTTGKLTAIAAPGSLGLAYTYDGSLLKSVTWSGAVAGSLGLTYDTNLRLSTVKVNNANTVTYQYDNESLLTKVKHPTSATLDLTLTHDAQKGGLLTGTSMGGATGVGDTFGYNGFGEMTSYSATANGSGVFATTYTRDKLGRITQKQETIGGITDTYAYTYDLAGRLIEAQKNTVTIAAYTYDSNGNRLSGPSATTTYTYDSQDRLLTQDSALRTFLTPLTAN